MELKMEDIYVNGKGKNPEDTSSAPFTVLFTASSILYVMTCWQVNIVSSHLH